MTTGLKGTNMTHAERDLLLAIARNLMPTFIGWDTQQDRYSELSNAISRVESERSGEATTDVLPSTDQRRDVDPVS